MDLTLYGDDSKGLIKLDPRTKMLMILSSGVLSFFSYNDVPLFVFCTVLCALLALCGKPWTALKGYLAFIVALYLRFCISGRASASPFLEVISQVLITVLLYCLPVVLSFILLTGTTRISQFISAFQAMHLPMKVIIPVAVFFRFIPTVQEEWTGIRKAMAFRGISVGLGSIFRHPMRTVEYVLIPMLFSSISVMEELASAALARGMDMDVKRSSYQSVRLGPADYIAGGIILAVTIYVMSSGW